MPKLTNNVPSYRLHKQSGQAIVTLNGRDFLLGPHGTLASRSKYNRLIAEWLANDRQPFSSDQNELTITDLAARYWRFASQYYVKNGRPTDEQNCIRAALRPLLKLYENELAANFGPVSLRAVRDHMISANWARQTINKNVDRIRRMFRWATSEERLPIETYQRLVTLPRLRKGRSEAKEAPPIRPVDDATVAATLPYLPDVLRAFRNGGAGSKSRRSKLAAHNCASLGGREDGALAPNFFNFAGRPRSVQRHGIVDRSSPSSADGPIEPAGRLPGIRAGWVDAEEDPGP